MSDPSRRDRGAGIRRLATTGVFALAVALACCASGNGGLAPAAPPAGGTDVRSDTAAPTTPQAPTTIAWHPRPAVGAFIVDWEDPDFFPSHPVEVTHEDVDLDGRPDRVESELSGGAGWSQSRRCVRLAASDAAACEEVWSTVYSRFYGRRAFVVSPSDDAAARVLRERVACEPADRSRPTQGAMWRFAEAGPASPETGSSTSPPDTFAPTNLRWFTGRPVPQATVCLSPEQASELEGAMTWNSDDSAPPVFDPSDGWTVVHLGQVRGLSLPWGHPTSDDLEVALELPEHVVYRAGHALAVWHRATDRNTWLESFDRVGPAYGYKVDRWPTIGEVRADGSAAIAVGIPSYSLGLARPLVVRIPLPEP